MPAPRHSRARRLAFGFSGVCLTLLSSCAHDPDAAARVEAGLGANGDAGATTQVADAAPSAREPGLAPSVVLARLPKQDDPAPFFLSQVGLYRDIRAKLLSSAAVEFAPAFPLWSDGADKQRWLILPSGSTIDTRDASAWKFPVGSLAFKEFRAGARRLETRLIARTGEAEDDFWMGAFVWNDDESDAQLAPNGALDVRGTQHDVPKLRSCGTCHRGDPSRFLGLSAIQRPTLPAALFSAALEAPFAPPGNAVEAAALGYLHANCAPCHNPSGSARPDTDLDLRLRLRDLDARSTLAYTSTRNVPLQYFDAAPGTLRVSPGAPDKSALLQRMRERGNKTQMPPLASEAVDTQGSAAIEAWIVQLQ